MGGLRDRPVLKGEERGIKGTRARERDLLLARYKSPIHATRNFRVGGTHLKANLHGNICLVKVTLPPDYNLFYKKTNVTEKIVMYKNNQTLF